jgi:hypothetical protein
VIFDGKFYTESQCAAWIYSNIGKQCRNLDGKTEIDGVPVTAAMIETIYTAMRKALPKEFIAESRIKDVLHPTFFDYRFGPHVRFPEKGWIANEAYYLQYKYDEHYGIYKVRRQPKNEYCVRVIFGEDIQNEYFEYQSHAIEYFNKITGLKITNKDFTRS